MIPKANQRINWQINKFIQSGHASVLNVKVKMRTKWNEEKKITVEVSHLKLNYACLGLVKATFIDSERAKQQELCMINDQCFCTHFILNQLLNDYYSFVSGVCKSKTMILFSLHFTSFSPFFTHQWNTFPNLVAREKQREEITCTSYKGKKAERLSAKCFRKKIRLTVTSSEKEWKKWTRNRNPASICLNATFSPKTK